MAEKDQLMSQRTSSLKNSFSKNINCLLNVVAHNTSNVVTLKTNTLFIFVRKELLYGCVSCTVFKITVFRITVFKNCGMKASESLQNKYIFKFNYNNTRASAAICSKLTFKK